MTNIHNLKYLVGIPYSLNEIIYFVIGVVFFEKFDYSILKLFNSFKI